MRCCVNRSESVSFRIATSTETGRERAPLLLSRIRGLRWWFGAVLVGAFGACAPVVVDRRDVEVESAVVVDDPRGFGAACAVDADCASGACTRLFDAPNAFADFCSARCTDDAGCDDGAACQDGFCFARCSAGGGECEALHGECVGEDGVDGEAVCFVRAALRCQSDRGCRDDERCALIDSEDGLVGVCQPAALAGLREGDACNLTALNEAAAEVVCEVDTDCTSPARCASRGPGEPRRCVVDLDDRCDADLCVEGVCSGACAADADCSAGSLCFHHDVGADGGHLVGFCEPFQGSGSACTTDRDCGVAGEHCGLVVRDGEQDTVCRAQDEHDVDLGDVCVDGCASNFCNDDNVCAALCVVDQDCGAGEVCVALDDDAVFAAGPDDRVVGGCVARDAP